MKPLPLLTLPAAGALALAALLPARAPAAPPAGPDGAALFRQRCITCHSLTPGQASPLGPNLAGVVGRKAATAPFAYSPALKAAGLTWTRQNLDRFMAAPARMVPGTRMVIAVPDGSQRAAILDHLAHAGH